MTRRWSGVVGRGVWDLLLIYLLQFIKQHRDLVVKGWWDYFYFPTVFKCGGGRVFSFIIHHCLGICFLKCK